MLAKLITLGSLPLLFLALLAAGLGVPIPEDPVLLAAGVTAHRTGLPWWLVLAVMYTAVLAADSLLFLMARHFGEAWLHKRLLRRFVTPERRAKVRGLFARYGARTIFIGRHMAGLRAVVFVLAGIEGVPLRQFVFWDGLAALVTVPAVFGLGYYFSAHVERVEKDLARAEHWIFFALLLVAFLTWKLWWRRRGRKPPSVTSIE